MRGYVVAGPRSRQSLDADKFRKWKNSILKRPAVLPPKCTSRAITWGDLLDEGYFGPPEELWSACKMMLHVFCYDTEWARSIQPPKGYVTDFEHYRTLVYYYYESRRQDQLHKAETGRQRNALTPKELVAAYGEKQWVISYKEESVPLALRDHAEIGYMQAGCFRTPDGGWGWLQKKADLASASDGRSVRRPHNNLPDNFGLEHKIWTKRRIEDGKGSCWYCGSGEHMSRDCPNTSSSCASAHYGRC